MGAISITMESLPLGALDSFNKVVAASLDRDRTQHKQQEEAASEARDLMRLLRTDLRLAKQALREVNEFPDEDRRDLNLDDFVESIEDQEKQYLDLHKDLVGIFRHGTRGLEEGELTEAVRPLIETVRELANLVAATHDAWQAVKWRIIEIAAQYGQMNPVGEIQGKSS